MKHYTIFLLLLLNFNSLKAQQYTQGITVDTTLRSGYFNYSSNCTQLYPIKIELDTSLYNYVTGLKFVIVIDTVFWGGPMGLSPIHPGDTVILNSSSPLFSTPPNYSGSFFGRIKVIGTPQIINQMYPCQIELGQCLCFCTDIIIKKATLITSTCYVDALNSINESETDNLINIYPNPSNGLLNINLKNKENTTYKIEIIDVFGNLIFQNNLLNITNAEPNVRIELAELHLSTGLYLINIKSDDQVFSRKIIIEQ